MVLITLLVEAVEEQSGQKPEEVLGYCSDGTFRVSIIARGAGEMIPAVYALENSQTSDTGHSLKR